MLFKIKLPAFRLYYKATVIKQHGTDIKRDTHINGTKETEFNTKIYHYCCFR